MWPNNGRLKIVFAFILKNTREDPGVVSQDRKSSRTGGRPTSFDCTAKKKNLREITYFQTPMSPL